MVMQHGSHFPIRGCRWKRAPDRSPFFNSSGLPVARIGVVPSGRRASGGTRPFARVWSRLTGSGLPFFCPEKTTARLRFGIVLLDLQRRLIGKRKGSDRPDATDANGSTVRTTGTKRVGTGRSGNVARRSVVNGNEVKMTIEDKNFSNAAVRRTFSASRRVGQLRDNAAQDHDQPRAGDCMHLIAPDARIATPRGEMRVDALMPGDLISTRCHGDLPILGIVPVTLARDVLIGQPRLTPVRIGRGALGNGLPLRTVCVAPSSKLAGLAGPTGAASVAVSDLIGTPRVERVFPDGVAYLRLVLPVAAEVLLEGIWHCPNHPDDELLSDGSMSWPISAWKSLAAVTASLLAKGQSDLA